MKIKDILAVKGSKVWTVEENETIHNALRVLADEKIGALLVSDERRGHIVGIISERDIVRGCHRDARPLKKVLVREWMTSEVIIASPEDEIDEIMSIMTEKRIRHIPVMSERQLQGIISIGDVVKSLLQDSAHQIRYLKEYVYGSAAGNA